MEFKKGDKVCTQANGNGTVYLEDPKYTYYVGVCFENNDNAVMFTVDGKENVNNLNRTLYHGHDLTFTVDERIPTRKVKRWVNLYCGAHEKEVVTYGRTYSSKQKAEDGATISGFLKTVEIEIGEG